MRIFVAGFQHETNTFAPSKADWAAFESGAGYPAVSQGHAMLDRLAPTSLPMGGFIRDAQERGWTLLPSIWAGATPSAQVTQEAFERIASVVIADARAALAAGGLDGIYLDLHGAAVAEHVDDAEGELLQRLRGVVGERLPVVASLDLHANVTRRMLQHASAMTAFRTYPHIDMAETGARAAGLLAMLCAPGAPGFVTHAERLPFLLPLNSQCTLLEPAAGLYGELGLLEALRGVHLSFAMGFPAADIAECGPVVFGHGSDTAAVRSTVTLLARHVAEERGRFALDLLDAADAVARGIALAAQASAPVVIADTQDNPGAGGDANTTGLLHALLAAGAGRRFPGAVALGLLCDPAAAAAAHDAGVGATLVMDIGQAVRSFDGSLSPPPLHGLFSVCALSDGVVPLHGPMSAGSTATLGPSACVEIDGVRVLLVSRKAQLLDLGLCRFLGVEPAAMKLIVVKSSVHFRAAFAPVAAQVLVARSPGPMAADPADLPWRQLPDHMARRP
jgi:microcystin degradation protein MlrC